MLRDTWLLSGLILFVLTNQVRLDMLADKVATHTGAGYVGKGLGAAMPVLGMIPGVGQAARLAQTVASGVSAGTGLASAALHAANNPSGGNVIQALKAGAAALPPQYKSAVQPYLNGAMKIAGQ